jgi:hypothetical protein
MPVKVHVIDEAQFMSLPTREVEIPDTCPHCGADLTESGALREGGFVWYSSPSYIEKADGKAIPEDVIESDGFEECFDAGTAHVGYMCNACDADLTAPHEADPEQERGPDCIAPDPLATGL